MDDVRSATEAQDNKAEAGRTRPSKLVERVFSQLMDRLQSDEFPENSKLPTETELALAFGVSRPIVRDALGLLRRKGIIYSRQGAGSFVRRQTTPVPALGYAPVETIADIQRCYEFRLAIEPVAAFYAAMRRDAAAIETIRKALSLLDDATRHRLHRADADFSFHKAVTDAANNHYYSSSMVALQNHVAVGMHMHGLSLLGPSQRLEEVFKEHNAIFEAVAAGDAELARDVMRKHLEGSRDRLFEGRMLDLSL